MDNINFKKVLDDGELFDQQANYEENFEKVNQEVVPKITDLETNKVDKVTGKGLSTNDFDNTYKQKIDEDIPAQLNEKVQNFKLKNEVVNGDFSQGTTGWKKSVPPSWVVVNNQLNVMYNSIGQTIELETPLPVTIGSKLYISLKAKSTGANTVRFRPDATNLIADIALTNTFTLYSYIYTAITSTYIAKIISLTGDFALNTVSYKDFILIKLTQIFGAGNEPTKLEMDELMKVIPNQWWDGELSLTQKQYITWKLNLWRKTTNAVIALGGTIV